VDDGPAPRVPQASDPPEALRITDLGEPTPGLPASRTLAGLLDRLASAAPRQPGGDGAPPLLAGDDGRRLPAGDDGRRPPRDAALPIEGDPLRAPGVGVEEAPVSPGSMGAARSAGHGSARPDPWATASAPLLDPDALAELVNESLVFQARLHGVDLT
jgi:hypothetical protein